MMNSLKTAVFLGALTALLVICGGAVGGRGGMILAFALAVAMNFASYWFSDKIVLKMYRAQPLAEADAPELHAIVDRLAQRARMPKPRVYLIPHDSPNAFATGRSPDHAVVAVTRGIVRLLDRDELEGVLAHELAHVRNRDILIGSVAATIAGAVTLLASMARWGLLLGGFGGRDERGGGLGLLVTALVAPFAAMLIQLAVSRSREYQADDTGAELTGDARGLASALEKMSRASARQPLPASEATSHLFIVHPLQGGGLRKLFSTHPPLEERIRRLRARR